MDGEEDEMGKLFAEDDEHGYTKYSLTDSNKKEAGTDSEVDEDDDDSEDEELMVKPVFVPKGKRISSSTKEQQEALQEAEEEQKRRLEDKRKELTRNQLVETLRRNENTVNLENADNDSNFGMPTDVSDYDDDVEVNYCILFKSNILYLL